MKRSRTLCLSAFILLAVLAGCGTVDGVGRDISSASNRVATMF